MIKTRPKKIERVCAYDSTEAAKEFKDEQARIPRKVFMLPNAMPATSIVTRKNKMRSSATSVNYKDTRGEMSEARKTQISTFEKMSGKLTRDKLDDLVKKMGTPQPCGDHRRHSTEKPQVEALNSIDSSPMRKKS